ALSPPSNPASLSSEINNPSAVTCLTEKQEGGFRFTRILRPVLHDRSGKRIARYSEAHRNGAERACLISRSLSCATSVEATIRLENQSPRNRFTLLACGRADSQLSYGCSPAFSFLSSGSD